MRISGSKLRKIIKEELTLVLEIIAGESNYDQGSTAKLSSPSSTNKGGESSTPNDLPGPSGIVIYGDTQIRSGPLGEQLASSNLQPGILAFDGATPDSFIGLSHQTISEAQPSSCNAVYLISLGGNGSEGAGNLARDILGKCPDAKIVWSGAPRAAEGSVVSHSDRQAINSSLEASLAGIRNVTFVDPYEHMEEWQIESGDDDNGLILPDRVAALYALVLARIVQNEI